MASEKPDKKEKKDKKQRATDEAGVKKDKKEKKEKKDKKEKLAAALEDQLQADAAAQGTPASKKQKTLSTEDSDMDDVEVENDDVASDNEDSNDAADLSKVVVDRTVEDFAVPLADEKGHKKIYKTVAKGSFLTTPSDQCKSQIPGHQSLTCFSYSFETRLPQARREGSCQVP